LDLSFNYFAHEEDLLPVLNVTRLDKLMLYGNPLMGPTGQDPLGIYIEDLLTAAVQAREGYTARPLEVRCSMHGSPPSPLE